MNLRGTRALGRPDIGTRATGLFKLTFSITNSGPIASQELASNIAFGDPTLQINGDYLIKFIYDTLYQATFVSPTLTSNRLRLGSGSSTGDLLDEAKDHSDGSASCGGPDFPPELRIAGSFSGRSSSWSDGRFKFRRDINGGVGRTRCDDDFQFTALVKLLAGASITAVNDTTIGGVPIIVREL